MRSHRLALGVLVGILSAPAVTAQTHPFLGVYEAEGYRLVLGADGDGYAGTLSVADQKFPVAAQPAKGGIAGTYTTALGALPFTATLEGDVLVLQRGGLQTRLRRHTLTPLEQLAVPEPRRFPALADLGPPRTDPARTWTVAVYMAADNDLEAAGLADLQEMLRGVPVGVDVVVLVDRAQGYAETRPDWTEARVLRITRPTAGGPARVSDVARLGELDLGDPDVLACFVEGAFRAFPAPQRALVLWDHGGGWASQCLDFDRGGPEGRGDLTLLEVRAGIEQGLARAGVPRLDLLGFDECLMAQLETAVEMAPLARYLVASQALEPGGGWPWDAVLPLFASQPEPRAVAEGIVHAYEQSYGGRDDSTTLAALDLDRTEALCARLDALVDAIAVRADDGWPALARALYFAESYCGRDDFHARQHATASVDLFDVLARMRFALRPFAAEDAFAAFVDAHRSLVLATRTGARRWLSRGLSVYAPPSTAQMDPGWRQTRLGASSAWGKLLAGVHARIQKNARAPRFAAAEVTGESGAAKDSVAALAGDQLLATLQGDNVVATALEEQRVTGPGQALVVRRGFVCDSQWIKRLGEAVGDEVDLMMPVYRDGESSLRHELQAMRFMVADATLAGGATVYFDSPDPREPIRVLASYEAPDHAGLWDVDVLFDPVTWDARGLIAHIPQPDGRVLRRGLDPHPAGTLSLWHETVDRGRRGRQRGALLTWGKGLRLVLEPDVPGAYVAALRAETMAGSTGETQVAYRVVDSEVLGQWRASWRAFRPAELAGEYEQYFLGPDGQPRMLGVKLTVAASTDGTFSVDGVHQHAQGPLRSQQTWHLDPARGTLRMVVRGAPGTRPSAYYGPAVWMGSDGLRAKMLNFGGVIWGFRKV